MFLLDNINTLDTDGELRLTIMSSMAQDESRKTSERVKWGQTRRRMEEGVAFGRELLGYDLKASCVTVNPERQPRCGTSSTSTLWSARAPPP